MATRRERTTHRPIESVDEADWDRLRDIGISVLRGLSRADMLDSLKCADLSLDEVIGVSLVLGELASDVVDVLTQCTSTDSGGAA